MSLCQENQTIRSLVEGFFCANSATSFQEPGFVTLLLWSPPLMLSLSRKGMGNREREDQIDMVGDIVFAQHE